MGFLEDVKARKRSIAHRSDERTFTYLYCTDVSRLIAMVEWQAAALHDGYGWDYGVKYPMRADAAGWIAAAEAATKETT